MHIIRRFGLSATYISSSVGSLSFKTIICLFQCQWSSSEEYVQMEYVHPAWKFSKTTATSRAYSSRCAVKFMLLRLSSTKERYPSIKNNKASAMHSVAEYTLYKPIALSVNNTLHWLFGDHISTTFLWVEHRNSGHNCELALRQNSNRSELFIYQDKCL